MNMQEIRSVAKDFGIKSGGMSKLKLIHSIQLSEGNFNCFASAVDGECDQSQCKWRKDCFAAAKKMHS
ncbi:MAG: SAP domain-containing protein [Gammaproteobacteria bacterium]|nr:SAP domain-containing protein [Gammaproteobacteria bacterium]